MTKFCPHCGKPVTDDITKTCSNCGTDLSQILPIATGQKRTTIGREEFFGRAIPFFTSKKYAIQAQTDYVIIFESQDRDVNWLIFVILCCCGIILGVIYYYWFTHKHQVTLSLSGTTEVNVTAIGNTKQAKKDAGEFIQSII